MLQMEAGEVGRLPCQEVEVEAGCHPCQEVEEETGCHPCQGEGEAAGGRQLCLSGGGKAQALSLHSRRSGVVECPETLGSGEVGRVAHFPDSPASVTVVTLMTL